MRRLRPLSFLLALATTLWTGGFSYLQFAPVANAAAPADSSLQVLGSPESLLQAGPALTGSDLKSNGQAFKDAVAADRAKLQTKSVQGSSVNGKDVTMAPSISENTIAVLPATMSALDSWDGVTVERNDASGRRYVAWIDGRDAASAGLSSIYFSRSTDNGATWSSPVRADNPAGGPAYVWLGLNLVADQQGHLVLVWDDYRTLGTGGGVAQVFYSRSSDAGQTWTTPTALTTDSRVSVFAPYINGTMDSDGNTNIFWSDVRTGTAFGPVRVYSIHSGNRGTSWDLNQIIDDSAGTGADFAQRAALGKNGEVMVGWDSNRAGGSGEDFILARSTNGGTSFAADVMINQYAAGTINLDRLHLCSDSHGQVLAAWMGDDPSTSDPGTIYTRTSADFGATWSATSPVLTTNADLVDPTPAACAFGSTHMAVGWQDKTNNALNVASSNDGGANWSIQGVERDVPLGCCDADEFLLGVDNAGRVLAVWTDSRNGTNDVFVNYSLDGGTTWQTADFKATNQVPSGSSTVVLGNASFSLAQGNPDATGA
ncbi:MAG: sialidase family protein [Candidatus Andersenbacteria bacterium]